MPEKLMTIPGVGAVTAQKLHDAGLREVDAVADATLEVVMELTGFYEKRATAIRAAATELASARKSAHQVSDVSVEAEISVDPGASPDRSKDHRKAKKKLRKARKKLKKARKKLKKARKTGASKKAIKKAKKKLKKAKKKKTKAKKKLKKSN